MCPPRSKMPRLSVGLEETHHGFEMKIVKELLDWCYENTKIHELRGNGSTSKKDNLLHWACENGHVQIAKYLLQENLLS